MLSVALVGEFGIIALRWVVPLYLLDTIAACRILFQEKRKPQLAGVDEAYQDNHATAALTMRNKNHVLGAWFVVFGGDRVKQHAQIILSWAGY